MAFSFSKTEKTTEKQIYLEYKLDLRHAKPEMPN